jgi:hypothetical protein
MRRSGQAIGSFEDAEDLAAVDMTRHSLTQPLTRALDTAAESLLLCRTPPTVRWPERGRRSRGPEAEVYSQPIPHQV